MYSYYLILAVVLLVSAVDQEADGGIIIAKRSADGDSNAMADLILEMDAEMDAEMDRIINELKKIPDGTKTEKTEVETVDGYDIETSETVINGKIGDGFAKVIIDRSEVLGKHDTDVNKADEDDETLVEEHETEDKEAETEETVPERIDSEEQSTT